MTALDKYVRFSPLHVVPWKTIPDSRPKCAKFIPVFRPDGAKTIPFGVAHTYVAYIRTSPALAGTNNVLQELIVCIYTPVQAVIKRKIFYFLPLQYIRLADSTRPELTLELMVRQWKLKKPDIVISIQGGLKNFHLDPHHKEIFNRGLIKAAKTTNCGAWIITGKTHFNGVVACGQKHTEIMFTFVRIVDEMKLSGI